MVEVAYFDGEPGKRIRVVVEYQYLWRPLFWIEVEKDGSIYCNFRVENPAEARTGTARIPAGESAKISYGDGDLVDPALLKVAKLSFHASGVSN
jgi:hypothetical protein